MAPSPPIIHINFLSSQFLGSEDDFQSFSELIENVDEERWELTAETVLCKLSKEIYATLCILSFFLFVIFTRRETFGDILLALLNSNGLLKWGKFFFPFGVTPYWQGMQTVLAELPSCKCIHTLWFFKKSLRFFSPHQLKLLYSWHKAHEIIW